MDIFLYASIADNCPLVVLEALACGVPIVTFATGGVPELVRHEQDGYVSPYKDVRSLVQSLEHLATQPDRRLDFSLHGRQHATSHFDHKIIARQYERLYDRCLEESKDSFHKLHTPWGMISGRSPASPA